MSCCTPRGSYAYRRYISKQEKVEWLNDYKKELENEIQGVSERLAELEAAE